MGHIDRRLIVRDAVIRTRYADDSLLKNWTSETGRLEIRGDTAQYSFGDKLDGLAPTAHVRFIRSDSVRLMTPPSVTACCADERRHGGKRTTASPMGSCARVGSVGCLSYS